MSNVFGQVMYDSWHYLSFCSVLWSWWFLWAWAAAGGRKPGYNQPGVRGESGSRAGWRLTHVRIPSCLHLHQRAINHGVQQLHKTTYHCFKVTSEPRKIEDRCGSVTSLQIEAELSSLFNNYSVQAVCFSLSHACQQAKRREEPGSMSKRLSGKMSSRPDLMQLQWRRKHTDQQRGGDWRKGEKEEEGCVVCGQPVFSSALHLLLAFYFFTLREKPDIRLPMTLPFISTISCE